MLTEDILDFIFDYNYSQYHELGCSTVSFLTKLYMPKMRIKDTNLNAGICASFCFSSGSLYPFILHDTTSCTCFNALDIAFPSSGCEMKCPGNQTQKCGGGSALGNVGNVYEFETSVVHTCP